MNPFAWNITLALAWSALAGHLSAVNLAVGFVFGYLVLAWLSPGKETRAYIRRLPRVVGFLGFYVGELVKSTLRVAWDVVTPAARRRPGIIAVPLDAETDAEITLLSNLITFTPGTLTLDVAPDRSVMIVHFMFLEDPDRDRAALKQTLERRVLELLR